MVVTPSALADAAHHVGGNCAVSPALVLIPQK